MYLEWIHNLYYLINHFKILAVSFESKPKNLKFSLISSFLCEINRSVLLHNAQTFIQFINYPKIEKEKYFVI